MSLFPFVPAHSLVALTLRVLAACVLVQGHDSHPLGTRLRVPELGRDVWLWAAAGPRPGRALPQTDLRQNRCPLLLSPVTATGLPPLFHRCLCHVPLRQSLLLLLLPALVLGCCGVWWPVLVWVGGLGVHLAWLLITFY